MKKINDNFKKHYPAVLFIAGYFFLLAWKTVKFPTPFFDWDESIYATVGREMIRNKSFLVPLWQGMPWLDKPPIPSLFYGFIQLLPFPPEISTRIATLILSSFVLFFLYMLSHRITKDRLVSLLAIVITAFLPIYFQRSIALNVDVFLLLGWLGYILWYENLGLSALFLGLAVLSKSLLGFFPPGIFFLYHTYCLLTKQITAKQFLFLVEKLTIQIAIASVWFIFMLALYRYPFIQYQFIDSHFKRVTASIEQHFGQRTFYVTVLIDQFKLLLIPAFISALYLAFSFFTKRKTQYLSLLALFFVPWFVFLNLTKTKIEWYIYPVLPQFSFLAAYSVSFFRKNTAFRFISFFALTALFFFTITPVKMLLTQPFSSWEDHQFIAIDAKKNNCRDLKVLVSEDTRTSYTTLKSMDLVISTTTWWGNHPSMAYYADTKTEYLYYIGQMKQVFSRPVKYGCAVIEKKDRTLFPDIPHMKRVPTDNKTYLLYKAI